MSMVLLRRRNLGKSSGKGIVAHSTTGIRECRYWRDEPPAASDTVIRWGCTANVASTDVLNTAAAIHQVNDKAGFRMRLQDESVDLVPRTATANSTELEDYVMIPFPVVVRPAIHSRGRDVHLCTGHIDLNEAIAQCGTGWYASEYIEKVAEYRVFVVQGRAVAVAEKTPSDPSDVAWNVARGGRFDVVSWDNWPLQAVRKSIEAFNLSDLDFGGVDVMVDEAGKAYVIEINSAPSLTSDYRQGCMAKAFDYISVHGKERIPLIEQRCGYRKFIHPAVCDRAILVENEAEAMLDSFVDHTAVRRTAQVDMPEPINISNGIMYQVQAGVLTDFTSEQLIAELERRLHTVEGILEIRV